MNYLVGKNTKLVKFTKKFVVPEYINWLNDHEVNRYLNTGRLPISAEQVEDPNSRKDLILFAIMSNIHPLSDDRKYFNNYIGTISLHSVDWINRSAEVGYMIGSKCHWGKGLATEIVSLITNYGFKRLNLNKIEAGVVDKHIASIRVLEKNGFRRYAKVPEAYFLEGKYHEVVRFYKLQRW